MRRTSPRRPRALPASRNLLHGVRKIAATIAAENGATVAIFGWLNIRQAEHYTREAERAQTGRASDGDSGRNQNFYSRTW